MFLNFLVNILHIAALNKILFESKGYGIIVCRFNKWNIWSTNFFSFSLSFDMIIIIIMILPIPVILPLSKDSRSFFSKLMWNNTTSHIFLRVSSLFRLCFVVWNNNLMFNENDCKYLFRYRKWQECYPWTNGEILNQEKI